MLEIYEYFPSREMDWILLGWLTRMQTDGELEKTLSVNQGTPSLFLQFFQHRRLFVTLDEFNNISRACWLEPCMGSVFLAYYIHPNFRSDQKEKVFFLYDIINQVFEYGANSIVGFIQQRPTSEETDKFIDLHVQLGYDYRGFLTRFFDGKDCHLVEMTAEKWRQGGRWKERWSIDRQSGVHTPLAI